MNWKDYLLIFSLSLITLVTFVIFQSAPGYMDAEYYYAMGLRIARDKTLAEPFVWNYLNGFSGLPQPGFGFWMPLPAFVGAISMLVTGGLSFSSARIGFICAAVLVPILTAKIAFKISGQKKIGIIAGLFGVFPTFYAPFITTIDSFGLMMLFGGGYLLVARHEKNKWKFYILGLLAGLMHLTRTDGFLWLVPGILLILKDREPKLSLIIKLGLGYGCVMVPWIIRNWLTLGSLFPVGNTRMLWMTTYDDLFLYHPELLTFNSWINQGYKSILTSILIALGSNLQTAIFIQGQIILFPLILIGIFEYRKDRVIQVIILNYILVLVVMTVVFPFAGSRGGFFHSGAAFQPLFWFLAATGISNIIGWGVKKRKWVGSQANLILNTGFVVLLLGITVFIHKTRVLGESEDNIQWDQSYLAAFEVDKGLNTLNITDEQVVMINNPPGLYIASGRSAVAIPSGGLGEVFEAAGDSEAEVLILEKNHPESLHNLYKDPGGQSELLFLGTEGGVQFYKILDNIE